MKLFTLFFLFTTLFVSAQTKQKPWGAGIYLGKEEFNGDLGDASFRWNKAFYVFGGLSLSRYVSPSVDVQIGLTAGEIGYWNNGDSVDFRNNRFQGNFYGNHYQGSVIAKFKFSNGYMLKENTRFQPYAFIGMGLSYISGDRVYYGGMRHTYVASEAHDYIVPVGIGTNVRITDRIFLNAQISFAYTDHDDRDGVSLRNNDGYLLHQIGAVYNFGKPVPSPIDTSFISKLLVMHNIDRDSDGIVDRIDDCPDVAGTYMAKGCPDRDFDGVADHKDSCPDVYGLMMYHGCPDTDGDGLPDYADACPQNPGPKNLNGCPDTDGDGIIDKEDSCVLQKGVIAFHGCPDTDKDGIPDQLDKCPNDAGPASNNGCPEIKQSVLDILKQALKGVQFQTSKSVILPKSYAILDNVAKVMKENPGYYLTINGHTDDQGDDLKNLKLSAERAKAVLEYLAKKGIARARMESRGYGETQPIDTNLTPEGRAINRRVEFKVTPM